MEILGSIMVIGRGLPVGVYCYGFKPPRIITYNVGSPINPLNKSPPPPPYTLFPKLGETYKEQEKGLERISTEEQ